MALGEGAAPPEITLVLRPAGGLMMQLLSTAVDLATHINNYDPGNGTHPLTATTEGSTVTVTGTVTGVTTALVLAIDPGVRVVWQANFSGSTHLPLVTAMDGGVFEMTDGTIVNDNTGPALQGDSGTALLLRGGEVRSTPAHGTAVYSPNASSTITIDGGTIEAKSEYGHAIISSAKVTVQSGLVKALNNGVAIETRGGADVEVTEGLVWANGAAISASGGVTMRGGATQANPGTAVTAEGDVLVTGGEVSAKGPNGRAIATVANVSVSTAAGTAVWITSDSSHAIFTSGKTITVDGGFIESGGDNSAALSAANGSVLVHDGYVGSTSDVFGSAISALNVTIKGGNIVAKSNDATIGANDSVTIQGGVIEARGSGIAIRTKTAGDVNVLSGEVSSATGYAIDAGMVTMDGGSVHSTDSLAINTGDLLMREGVVYSTNNIAIVADGHAQIEGGQVSAEKENTLGIRGSLTMSGGTVRCGSEDLPPIFAVLTNVDIEISGGLVLATGAHNSAIEGEDMNIRISGGQIVSQNDAAIDDYGSGSTTLSGSVTLSGGVVLGRGQITTDVVKSSLSGPMNESVIIAWRAEATGPYAERSNEDLLVFAAADETPVTFFWLNQWGTQTGVRYETVSGTVGFAPVDVALQEVILDMTLPSFAPVTEGYKTVAPEAIEIQNAGDLMASGIKVSLTGEEADCFELKAGSDTVAAQSSLTDWTLRPVDGLQPGSYTVMVTLEWLLGGQALTLPLTFDVNPVEGPYLSEWTTVTPQGPLKLSVWCETLPSRGGFKAIEQGSELYKNLLGSDGEKYEVLWAYDISLEQPWQAAAGKQATLLQQGLASYEGRGVRLVHQAASGRQTSDGSVKNGSVSFEMEPNFSPFMLLVEKENGSSSSENNPPAATPTSSIPKTGDDTPLALLVTLAVASASVLFLRRKR